MGGHSKKSSTDLHLRFNSDNKRHREAAVFISTVKQKQKTALITAAIEAYRTAHPHGVDYVELEAIQKETWSGFLPKVSILENLKKKHEAAVPVVTPAPAAWNHSDVASDKAIDQAIDFYNLDSDEDE